ncbi:hypothetical protein B296_00004001 [Ensete ventricosum]|uniref:Uncharacterized protein n=1 Tax=Ensete ventricosum TaxID=4639 RepID=A0A427B952_ENSVE|nr:hypothetical protein B296_00004001 [Ensete ventricosum]
MWQVRLRLRRKAAAASRGSRKQGSSGGGRCGSKNGNGGWATLEGAATAALDLQAGRVSKAKGAVKAAAGKGGRKRAATVRRGLRQRENGRRRPIDGERQAAVVKKGEEATSPEGLSYPKSKVSVRKEVDSKERHSAVEADLPIVKEGTQMQGNGY